MLSMVNEVFSAHCTMNAFVVALLWLGFSEKLVLISSGSVRDDSEGDRERHRRSLDDDEKLDLLCGDARDFFRGKGLLEKGRSSAEQGETPSDEDAELKICATTTMDVERRQSCCTSEIEHQLQVLSFNDMRQIMSSSMTPVRHDLIVAMNSFTDEFRAILRAFENSTFHILANTFRIPTAEVHVLLDKLISRLIATSSSKGQKTSDQLFIGKVIAEFYDELFIAAVHNLLKFNVSADSSGEGRRCLTALRKDTTLMPFGDYPTLFEQHFRRSQGAALMFASGLQLVSDYFNVTVNEDLAEKCLHSVTRMTYCPLCQGLTNTVPCPGKCASVLRDCRHSLLGVSDGIRRFAGEAIDSVQAELSTISDAVLPSMVSKSLLKVIETGHTYRNQIVKKCGFRKSNGSGALSSSVIPSNNVKTLSDGDGLRQTLETLRLILIRTSDLLAALPTTFCNTTKTSSSAIIISDDRCWNGTSLQLQSALVKERMEIEESLKDTDAASETYTARLLNEMTSMLQGIHRRPQKAHSKADTETGAQTTSGKTQRPPRLRPVKYDAAAAAAAATDDDEDDEEDSDEDNDDQFSGGESGQSVVIADTFTSTMKVIELTSRRPETDNAPLSSSNLIRQPTTVTIILSLTTTILYYACSCRSI